MDKPRDTGIGVVGDAPWGTHFCQFYQTKEDLLDTLVPYFKAGLENNEFCMWVTAEPLTAEAARQAIGRAVPDFQSYVERGQIEILSHDQWYMKDGYFDADRVLNGWVSKLDSAKQKGFDGLRLTGNTFWLEKSQWGDFADYEATVNDVIGKYDMVALCTYSLDKCNSAEVVDVIRNHQFALIRQKGKWELIESSIYRQAQEALRQSEEKYRGLFNTMTEALALCDIVLDSQGRPCDWRYVQVNPAFEKLIGLTAGQVTGRTVREVLPGIESHRIEIYGKVALTGESVVFETYSTTLGRWYEAHAYSPKKGQFVTLLRDVTERRESEEKVKKVADEWQATFDSITDMVSIQDRDFRLVRVNRAYANALKMTPEELIGKRCYEMIHGMTCPIGNCPFEQTLKTKTAVTQEMFEPRLGVYLEASTSPILNESGEVLGSVHVAKDITARKRAEAEVAHLASFPELNPMLVLELDVAGNVKYVNPTARRDFPGIEAEGTRHPFLADWESQVGTMRGENTHSLNREVKIGDSWYGQTIAYMPLTQTVRIYGWDTTERKRAEDALQAKSEELARSNTELEQFAYVASHDLQEPLRMVSSYVQLLASRYQDRLDQDANDFIHFASDGAVRMQKLINDLLAYSRVGTRGKEFREVSLEPALAQALRNLQIAIKDSGAFITHDPLPTVRADARQIEQLFQNLIDNAIKFRGEEPPQIHVSAALRDNCWVFSVADNGIGVEPEFSDRIFVIFQRLHSRDKYPGTGIGLAICNRIVERHGGKIWVESVPGKGSTFCFTIPSKIGEAVVNERRKE